MKHGDSLPSSDSVSRLCSPDRFDHRSGLPKVTAFVERKNERCDYSVNRLEHYAPRVCAAAINLIRSEFIADEYDLRPRGRFVVFNVGRAIKAAAQHGARLSVTFTPDGPYCSHSTIKGLPDPIADQDASLRVATAIKRLVRRKDVLPALV